MKNPFSAMAAYQVNLRLRFSCLFVIDFCWSFCFTSILTQMKVVDLMFFVVISFSVLHTSRSCWLCPMSYKTAVSTLCFQNRYTTQPSMIIGDMSP